MRIVLACAVVSAALISAAANAQTNPPERPAQAAGKPAPETPPENKAFTDASRIMDPAKKIEALEKWKKDYPNASNLSSADQLILATLIERFPQQSDRVRKLAKSMYQGARSDSKSGMANRLANALLENDAFLKDAEHYAKIAAGSTNEAKYLEQQHKQYAERKQKPPDDVLLKRFRETHADRIATLGRVYYKMGLPDRARPLLEQAYSVVRDEAVVAAALGDIAFQHGDQGGAAEYLLPALLSGRPAATAIARPDMEAIYRKAHGESLDGFDAMLDTEYRRRFPNPVRVEAYKPSEKRSDRLVLAEVFTGAGCPPCVGADLAFDAALERYARKDLAVVMYHVHVPQPDPMTTAETPDLSKSYGVRGVPTYFIDGKDIGGGGGDRDFAKNVYDRFNPAIEKELETPAEAKIVATAALEGDLVHVKTSVRDIGGGANDLKLVVLLLEKQMRYAGENGIRFHSMVVRAAAEEDPAPSSGHTFDLAAVSDSLKSSLDEYEAKGHRGKSFKFTEKKYRIDRGDLAVVVFLKDPKSEHVLQAAYIDLTPDAERRITESK